MPWPTAFNETPTPPTAGNELSTQLAGQYRFHILNVSLLLSTDGTAANRFVSLSTAQSANVMYKTYSPVAIVANENVQLIFDIGHYHSKQIGALDVYQEALNPWFIVEPSWDFQINVDNMEAGDTLTNIIITYGRWSRTGES